MGYRVADDARDGPRRPARESWTGAPESLPGWSHVGFLRYRWSKVRKRFQFFEPIDAVRIV